MACLAATLTNTSISHTHSYTQKLTLTHTHTQSLDSLSVIELWRGSAVTTSITHPGERCWASEKKGKLGQERGEKERVWEGEWRWFSCLKVALGKHLSSRGDAERK